MCVEVAFKVAYTYKAVLPSLFRTGEGRQGGQRTEGTMSQMVRAEDQPLSYPPKSLTNHYSLKSGTGKSFFQEIPTRI